MDLLLRSIGVSSDVREHLDQAQLAFQRPLFLWGGLLLLLPLGYFIYRRQQQNLQTVSPRFRIVLSATRIFVLALLLLIAAGPYLKLEQQIERKPIFAVLLDASQSMQLPAGPFDSDDQQRAAAAVTGRNREGASAPPEAGRALEQLSRSEVARATLRHAEQELFKPLSETYDVRYYTFARTARPLVIEGAGEELPTEPEGGTGSHLGEAVDQVLEEAAGRPVAGMLLLTDGQNTGGPSPSQAARVAADGGAKIFGVTYGSQRRGQDVSVVDVYTSGLVAVGDTVAVHATLETQGFDGRTVTVELKDQDEVLATREIVLRDAEQQQVELTFKAAQAGTRFLQVQVPPQDEEPEALRSNNADSAFVRISDQKLKVLLIDGLPRWDFRFLKNAARRDHGLAGRLAETPDILLETEWRRLPAADRAAALPQDLEELSQYHTIILGDASEQLLSADFCRLVAQAVRDRGVGLLLAAGPQAMPHRASAELQELLPVRLNGDRSAGPAAGSSTGEPQPRSDSGGLSAPVYNPFQIAIGPAGTIHETMRLFDDPGRNQEVWDRMPPFYWCAAAERPAAGATVLAWNKSLTNSYGQVPLIAFHYAGAGKVLFVGTDSTWLWRQNVGDRYFYRFWGQAIRFVARREQGDDSRSWLEVRPLRAQPGETAKVELMARDAQGKPVESPALTAAILGPDSRAVLQLTADPARKGLFVGSFAPEQPGVHRVIYRPEEGGEPVEASLQVLRAPAEFRHPHANRAVLETFASATGGRVLEGDELKAIAPLLEGEVERHQLHREATLWDNWLMLSVLVLVYSCDVGLRRLMGLS